MDELPLNKGLHPAVIQLAYSAGSPRESFKEWDAMTGTRGTSQEYTTQEYLDALDRYRRDIVASGIRRQARHSDLFAPHDNSPPPQNSGGHPLMTLLAGMRHGGARVNPAGLDVLRDVLLEKQKRDQQNWGRQ